MYLKSTELMDRYQISRSTVYRILKEMQESNRYPPNAIIGVGKRKRISVEAFQDYYVNMEWLRHPNMKKFVKPYREG